MNPAVIEEKLKQFKCARCNECCRQPGFVYLEEGEAERISEFLKLDAYKFTNQFCNIQDRRKLVLKKLSDESCVFLTEQGCSVHSVKPKQCRDFPISWRTEKSFTYCEGMKKLFP